VFSILQQAQQQQQQQQHLFCNDKVFNLISSKLLMFSEHTLHPRKRLGLAQGHA
jgi:hypothetical protein